MKRICSFFLLFSSLALAQIYSGASLSSSSFEAPLCPNIDNIPGMLIGERSVGGVGRMHELNLKGIVQEVSFDTVRIEFSSSIAIYPYFFNCSDCYPGSKVRKISLKSVEATSVYNEQVPSFFDSSAVYVPIELDVQKNDSIVLYDYIAGINMDCRTWGNSVSQIYGKIELYRKGEIMSLNRRIKPQEKVHSFLRNRDALGKEYKEINTFKAMF